MMWTMPSQGEVPDYELADSLVVGDAVQLKAMADPLRTAILDLVLERAATVSELAEAFDRAKSTVAYHVDVLVEAGLLTVVRTRRVRAVEERFYGRAARTFVVSPGPRHDAAPVPSFIHEAAREARHDERNMATLRHARIPADRAEEFFARVGALAEEFTRLERGGEEVYGFVAAVYPTDRPILPDPDR